jgi:hypothetical protein
VKARDRRMDDFLQLVTVAAAALVGGLLAMIALAIRSELQPGLMLFVVVVVMLLAVLTVGSLQTSPNRTRRGPARQPPWPPPPPPLPPVRRTPRRPEPPVFGLDPTRPSPTNWYDDEPAAARPPPDTAVAPRFSPPRPSVPPLDVREPAYEAYAVPGAPQPSGPPVRRIVQCPACGDFEVDVRPGVGNELAFTCLRRRHEWTWARGRPWPATVVRPAAAPVTDTA